MKNGTDDKDRYGLDVLILISDDHVKLDQTVLNAFFECLLYLLINVLNVLKPVVLGLFPTICKEFIGASQYFTNLFQNLVQLHLYLLSMNLLLLLELGDKVTSFLVYR